MFKLHKLILLLYQECELICLQSRPFPNRKHFLHHEKDQKVDPGILSREDWDNNPLTKIQPTGLLSSQTFTDHC